MDDCDICFSAGSVNRWGVCDVCGEELEHQPVEVVPVAPDDGCLREEALIDAPGASGPVLRAPGPRSGDGAGDRVR